MTLKAADAAERRDIFWTVSYGDDPVASILSNPYRAAPGTSHIVGLTFRHVTNFLLIKN